MVLLKQKYLRILKSDKCSFTFHYGLIKTRDVTFDIDEKENFTFHYGLIKTQPR